MILRSRTTTLPPEEEPGRRPGLVLRARSDHSRVRHSPAPEGRYKASVNLTETEGPCVARLSPMDDLQSKFADADLWTEMNVGDQAVAEHSLAEYIVLPVVRRYGETERAFDS